ncbi:MAG: hypothetical protein JW818_15480 [Pirellulales bacterium]|nr:hypothetical protein [Pirellulales bacterium]
MTEPATPDSSVHAVNRRPWWRLHFSTWLVLVLVIVFLVLLMVPGVEDPEVAPRLSFYESPWSVTSQITYAHGWPWCFLERKADSPDPPQSWILPGFWGHVPWRDASSWALTTGTCNLRPWALVGDAAVAVAILLAVGGGWEWRRRRRHRVWQFSLRELLILTLLVGLGLGWWRSQVVQNDRERARCEELDEKDCLFSAGTQWCYRGPAWLGRLVGQEKLAFCRRVTEVTLASIGQSDDLLGKLRLLDESIDAFPCLWKITFYQGFPRPGDPLRPLPPDYELPTGFGQIESLNLDCESAPVVPFLACFNSVRSAKLSTPTAAALAQLAELPGVEELELPCDAATEENSRILARFPRLRRLTLQGVHIRDEDMAHLRRMTNLQELSLSAFEIDQSGLCHLHNLPHLRKITITFGGIEPEDIVKLKEALPDCEVIQEP